MGEGRSDRSELEDADAGAPEAAVRGGAPPVLEAERRRLEREGRRERRVSVSAPPLERRRVNASSLPSPRSLHLTRSWPCLVRVLGDTCSCAWCAILYW